ncbi:MAG: polyvinylalcohol dehydrogenase [Pedosphaera sp.]|nr:polyvinylalcohol dehydrogenase [Pedosphaera sp.]
MVLAFATTIAAAGDWPQWRGPRRDGISTETGLKKDWPPGGPGLAWKIAGLGSAYSSVTVSGDKVFTGGEKGESAVVFALARNDGHELWSAKLGKSGNPGDFEGPRSTPTLDGGYVYALGQYGDLVCLDAKDGNEVWRRDYVKDFGGRMPNWGFSESVLVDGDNVICTPGGPQGTLVALDKKTGKEVWRSKDFSDPPHYSSAIVAEIDGVRQYIQLTERNLAGIATKDGKVLWKAPRKGSTAVVPTPIYNDNHVYVTSGYGIGCNLFKITKDTSGFKVEEVSTYGNKVMVNHHGGVILIGDHVYGYSDGKGWTCQDFKTGKAVWQEKDKLGKGSVVFAGGRLYCRQQDGKGTVAIIEASPTGWKEHGRFDQPDRSDKNSWAHPVVSDGKLYIRDQDILLCYEVKAK